MYLYWRRCWEREHVGERPALHRKSTGALLGSVVGQPEPPRRPTTDARIGAGAGTGTCAGTSITGNVTGTGTSISRTDTHRCRPTIDARTGIDTVPRSSEHVISGR